MGRISNTIALAKVSWKVLRKDRELLLLPVLSFLASIVVLALLWLPTLSAIDTSGLADESGDPGAVLIVVGVISAMAMSIIMNALAGSRHGVPPSQKAANPWQRGRHRSNDLR